MNKSKTSPFANTEEGVSLEHLLLKTGEEKIIKYQPGYLITVILASGEARVYSGGCVETLWIDTKTSLSGEDGEDVKVYNPFRRDFKGYVITSKLE